MVVLLQTENLTVPHINIMKAKYFIAIVLVVMILSLISGMYLGKKYFKSSNHVSITTIPGDSTNTEINLPVPDPIFIYTGSTHWYPVYKDTGQARWRYHDVDTNAILKDYHSRKVYNRILKDDSSAFISLQDTVSRNRLTGSKLIFNNRRPLSIIDSMNGKIPVNYQPVGLYAGFSVGRSSREFGIGPSIMLLRKNTCYSVVYDLTNKDLYFTVSAPIWKPRKVP